MTVTQRVITGPHFITTTPALVTCRHCAQPTLTATVGGIDRHIDIAPLTPAGELAALLEHRATYNLIGARRDHLVQRTVHHIRAADQAAPVLADHNCRPTPPHQVDHTHLQGAAQLVRDLLGGQPVADNDTPPY